ncbi:MAG: aldo/keto reductase [Methanoregula sp.]|nr:aldo/keto reductase [Methanoregula sp.]
MFYKKLGRTGLSVSTISFGTVSLGVDYGIEVPGNFGRPEELEVIQLLRKAADAGINFFDTAPNYGTSELCLGEAIGERSDCYIATKVSIPPGAGGEARKGNELSAAIDASLASSMKNLKRDYLDIVQIHNATLPVINDGAMAKFLLRAKDEGIIHFIGASVYTEAEALAVIEAGCFDVLQVAYNLLDQRMAAHVFPAAKKAGIGIIVRSALLKGVLTCKSEWLPPELSALKAAALMCRDTLAGTWEKLPGVAVRFCIASPEVSSVLVGIRTSEELLEALGVSESGPFSESMVREARDLALQDAFLLNPSNWPVK